METQSSPDSGGWTDIAGNLPLCDGTLDRMGITYKTYTGHSGIVADFGNGQGKTVAIRGDMDGLPIEEDTGLEFSSENKNMHACGHDAHTAILWRPQNY